MKQTLQQIFNEIGNLTDQDRGGNDKGGKIHTYLETYDKLFERFRDGCDFLEIGLASGDSIKLWNRYFENSNIVGVDLSIVFELDKVRLNRNIIKLISADATNPNIVDVLENEFWPNCKFNLILDDADHRTISQITTFNLLKHKVKKGGYYILEDILALDIEREKYLALHDKVEIVDMRANGRFDNVLIIYYF